jgi:hypothetical protein
MHDVALVLLTYLGDRTIVPRLRDLVRDAPASDAFKLKLIGVIHDLEPEQDSQSLLDFLRYPGKAMLQSHRRHLQRLASPLERSLWMELMVADAYEGPTEGGAVDEGPAEGGDAGMSPEARISFARSCAAVDDPAAVPVLVCMCYDPEPEVALAAMDAVERYKDARALPALRELARHHPHPQVREEAQKTADRLGVRVQLAPPADAGDRAAADVEPLVAAYLTTVDGQGEQAAVFVRRVRCRPAEGGADDARTGDAPIAGDHFVRLVQVAFGDQTGIVQCFGLDLHVDDLEEVLGELGAQGLAPVRVAYERALDQLSLACRWTWDAGGLLPLSFVAWREWIYGRLAWQDEGTATGPILARPDLSDAERRQLYETCYELLYQDEFLDWGWKAPAIDGLVAAYRERVRAQGEPLEDEALRALLLAGVKQLADAGLRQRLAARLIRVAPLLRELYGGDVVWQWAVVAADALRGEVPDGVPNRGPEHPFLLGLAGHSLQQALDRDLDWTSAISRALRP